MTKKVKKIAKPKVKKEIVEIVKKAERTNCVEGNIQVKLGTAPKINYIRECTGTS